jgi:hypothetical protein
VYIPEARYKNMTTLYLKEVDCQDVDWPYLAQAYKIYNKSLARTDTYKRI